MEKSERGEVYLNFDNDICLWSYLAHGEKMQLRQSMRPLKAKTMRAPSSAGMLAKLTQSISKFALKPGEEEIKKKGWWQSGSKMR